jgi:hypothetical protein
MLLWCVNMLFLLQWLGQLLAEVVHKVADGCAKPLGFGFDRKEECDKTQAG